MQTIKYWIESEQMREHKRKEREKAEAEAKAIKVRRLTVIVGVCVRGGGSMRCETCVIF